MVSLCHLPSGKILSLLNIYVPSLNKDKKNCWLSIFSLLYQTIPTSLIFVGYFNTIMQNFEKRGGSIVRESSSENMEYLISTFDLMDIQPTSGLFTWSNKIHGLGHIVGILDRFLINRNILEESLIPSSRILPWSGLDHRPISLELTPPTPLGPIPFLFNPQWAEDPCFF